MRHSFCLVEVHPTAGLLCIRPGGGLRYDHSDRAARRRTDESSFTGNRPVPAPCLSLLRVAWPGRALGVPEVCAVHLLLWCDPGRRFTGGHGIASHRLLESWCREDERQSDRFGADVLPTDPGVGRDEHQPSGMEIALLIAEPN